VNVNESGLLGRVKSPSDLQGAARNGLDEPYRNVLVARLPLTPEFKEFALNRPAQSAGPRPLLTDYFKTA
jgi:hypothetical protein